MLPRSAVAIAVSFALAVAAATIQAGTAEAAVVKPFTLEYDKEVYGDFLYAGNGVTTCPDASSPADPGGEPKANCATAQTGTLPTTSSGNDAYYMRWADVDSSSATYNSSSATITIPAGARVDYAKLSWSGDTGTIKLANGATSTTPGCNTRQFNTGAGSAVVPTGTPAATSVRLTVGTTTTSVAPGDYTVDPLTSVPAGQPQYYTADANVSARFANVTTGSPVTITVGNVWTPQGFGCSGGWSIDVVYAFDAPGSAAPVKREVFVYDGHVRQSSTDAATTVTVSGFRIGAAGTRVGLTAYEGDRNITGDQFAINGTNVAEPSTGATSNYFISRAEGEQNPTFVNNMSVDVKQFNTTLLPVGATSGTFTFSTSGDTYLAQNLTLSVPIPSLEITKTVVGSGPFRPGQTVTFQITVASQGGPSAANVAVSDPAFGNCNRNLGTLAANTPVTYTCTGTVPSDSFTNTATVTGQNTFGDTMTDSASVDVTVVNAGIDIVKTTDKASYAAGETVTFTITTTNTGNSPLTNVAVTDAKVPACARTQATLAAGASFTYTCTATAPIPGDGNTATVTAVDAGGATVTDTATVTVPTQGSIAGQVFSDRDNNGVLDQATGDTAIAGVTVRLTGRTTTGVAVDITTTTGADGRYAFVQQLAGTYTVTETQPANFDDGVDTPGAGASVAGNDTFTVVLGGGAASDGNNFAERPTSSLAGSVYEDLDNDGVRSAGERGIAGVAVSLVGTDAAGGAVGFATTTDANGDYVFDDLRAGTYDVEEVQPVEYSDGRVTAGTAGGTARDGDTIADVALPDRTDATGYLFGEFVSTSISGRVVDDAGAGIAGVTVTLSTAAGAQVGSVRTDGNGAYSFVGLAPGSYEVAETQPVGYGDGGESAGSAGGTVSDDRIRGIVLASGTAATGYDFDEVRGSLSGVVYVDANNDGTRGGGEPGIGGVTVTLAGTDAVGNPVDRSVTTDADGGYLFDGLLGGTYTVTETQPDGYLDGRDAAGSAGGVVTPPDAVADVRLDGGENATGYQFGELSATSVAGAVVDDAGTGIPGVTIALTGADDNGTPVSLTTRTDGEGAYAFAGLRPGTYTVTETQPVGYGDGPETVGTAGGDDSVNDVVSGVVVGSGTVATGYTFTEDRGSLSGVVYEDVNDDGVRDAGEPGIGGAVILLTGTDAAGGPVELTATTGADGGYVFDGLLAGTYTVTETSAPGYLDGRDRAGSAGGTVTPPDSVTGVVLDPGEDATGYLFGELISTSISGRVTDEAGNGIPGVTVALTGTDDNGAPVSLTTSTNGDGYYTFLELRPGTYTMTETQPAGYGDGPESVGSLGGDASTNDVISDISLPENTVAQDYDFTETRASVAGAVYEDRDNDGVRDAGEPGIGGVSMTLTGTDVLGNPVDLTGQTDEDGGYLFDGLLAGTYAVAEAQPEGYLDGVDRAGSAGGAVAPPDSVVDIRLDPGEAATGYSFGELTGASVSGRVADDAGNGIPGVTITLTGTDDTGTPVSTTVTTDGFGNYTFAGLRPGTYTVAETQPVGYGDGVETVGSAGGDGSVNDVFSGIVVGSGTAATGYVFAEVRGSLSGVVYEDVNNNGVRDGGEPGIAGVGVTLTGSDAAGGPVELTVQTDGDGGYRFEDLLGGTYVVLESQPDGYLDGVDAAGSSGGTVLPPDSIGDVVLAAGADATGYVFGEFRATSIAGQVVDDAGDGISGVVVTLTDGAGNQVGDPVVTDAGGNFSFTGLAPGTYTVTETQPVGYGDGAESAGAAGGDTPANDVISGIVLGSGTAATGYTFTEDRGSLAGAVYEDVNNNGVRDDGEAGIEGVTVTLTGTDAAGGPVELTATTGADGGGYVFDGLLAGTYTVTETQPGGYSDGADTAGSAGGTLTAPDSVSDIPLPAGGDADGYLFGEFRGTSIAGQVVNEAGGGIPGVTVTLTDAGGSQVGQPVTTDAQGDFAFTGLAPGTYTITQTQPAGYSDGADTAGAAGGDTSVNDVISGIVLTSGQTADGYVFTDVRGALAGSVYDDRNINGTRDADESGIPDVTITLTGTDASGTPVERTTRTDQNGDYTFDGVVGGTYTITETQPDEYLDGTDVAGSAGGTPTAPDSVTGIELAGGERATGYLFGEYLLGELAVSSLSGRVLDDGGNGIPGVTVTLTGTDDLGNPVSLTTQTDAEGDYTFYALAPGTYTVTETQPPGYGDGADHVGTAGGTVGDDVISGIVIALDAVATGYDFTETRGELAGSVYEDTNGNGVRDSGEAGIPDVTVTLSGTDAGGEPVEQTTRTDGNGDYRFAGVLGGTYAITETQPPGYGDGADIAGTAGGTPTQPDTINGIELPAGEAATGYLFGERSGVITGTVWLDINDDGVIDADEAVRLGGITVILLDPDGDEITRTTTAANGTYTFPHISSGDYTLRELQPDGYGSTTPNEVPITVSPGGGGTVHFGEQRGLIGDFVWSDTNGDGLQDADEPGAADVPVVLLDSTGAELARTTTDGSGAYRFTNLAVGTYQVRVELPAGQALTRPNAGGESRDSDFDRTTGVSGPIEITLSSDRMTQRTDVDAGLVTAQVDLAAELTVDVPTAGVGDPVTFTGTVTNTGTTPVTGATVTITIPNGMTIVSATGDGWTCATTGQTVTCTTGAVLAPGEAAPPITVATAAATPILATDALMTVAPADNVPDDNPYNDTATTAVAVTEVIPPAPQLPAPGQPAPHEPAPGGPQVHDDLPGTGRSLVPAMLIGLALLVIGLGSVLGTRRREDVAG